MRLLLILCISCLLSPPLSAQSDRPLFDITLYENVPDTLLESLQTYYTRKTAADLEEYRFKERGKWLKYLPNVGISLVGPSVGAQSSTIYQARNDKVKKEAKVQSILKQNQLAFEEDCRRLRHELIKWQMIREDLRKEHEVEAIRQEIWQIDSLKYANSELLPSQYLKKKQARIESLHRIYKLRQQITLKWLEIEALVHYEESLQPIQPAKVPVAVEQ